jgi:hypothetical protein
MKKKDLDKIESIIHEFIEEEIHGADFDQGQSLNQTQEVFSKWWNKKGKIKLNGYITDI